MKAIPTGFCEAADSAVIPGRPWWRLRETYGAYVRRDGAYVFVGEDPFPGPATAANNGGTLRMSAPSRDRIVEAVERIDAEHPIPHPGFRAGQVWLEPYGEGWTERVIVLAFGGTSYTPDGGRGVTSRGGSFLLHDPLMPSKAPWGPA